MILVASLFSVFFSWLFFSFFVILARACDSLMKMARRQVVHPEGESGLASAEATRGASATTYGRIPCAAQRLLPPPTKDTQEPLGRGLSMSKGRSKVHKSGQGGRIS